MTRLLLRGDTEANWASVNPILALDEPGHEQDTDRLKIGDGVTRWNDLGYWAGGASAVASVNGQTGVVDLDAGDVGADPAGSAAAAQTAAEATAAADATTKANAAKAYADTLVVGLVDDRGNYDASVNTFPASGGSGSAGAVLKGDLWTVSVAGTLGGNAVTAGDLVRALVDAPGQTAGNWAVTENNIGYVAEPQQTAASQAEAEAGSGTSIRSWTPQRIWQAIAAALGLGTWISGATGKSAPVDADTLPISDSAASGVLKSLTFANLWTWIKGKTDPLYRLADTNSAATAYTLTAADHMTRIRFTAVTEITVTVNTGVVSSGFYCELIQGGAGQVVVVAGGGMTQRSAGTAKSRAQFSPMAIDGASTAIYYVSGDMSAS